MDFLEEENNMSVFKSYLRKLLRDLEDIRENAENNDTEKLKEKLDSLIDDTKKDIETN